MRAISGTTHAKIKAYLEVFIENLVERYKNREISNMTSPEQYLGLTDSKGGPKPFHAAMIPSEVLRISAFERGFVTTLGTSFEECAKLIALDYHADAIRSHDLAGNVSTAGINEIERQVASLVGTADTLDENYLKPDLDTMIASVLDAITDEKVVRTTRVDLYIKSYDDIEYYFEIKSPKPNKDQCLEMTRRILGIHLLKGLSRPKVKAYYAMPYNPYGENRSSYSWSIPIKYMPYDKAVLIGHEFWDIVGGPTTYQELLSIYREVGREKAKYIIDSLAFGF